MNTGFVVRRSFCLVLAILLGVAALVSLAPVSAPAQPALSPIGGWDIVLSGKMRGVAFASFNEDGTISGDVVYTFKDPSLVVTNQGTARTNLYGAGAIDGHWLYERTNRISGFMNLISQGPTDLVTNGLSFRGIARATRLNLEAYGTPGKIGLRGIPYTDTNAVDIGGKRAYLGAAKARRLPFPTLEVFHLTLDTPNFYDIEGEGPAFAYTGTFLVSNQRVAALFQDRGTAPGRRVAAYAGPFSISRRRGTLIGTDGIDHGTKYRIVPEVPTSTPE